MKDGILAEPITLEERTLQIERYMAQRRISCQILKDRYIDLDQIGLLLSRDLAVENLRSETVHYPATWWQAVKQAFYRRGWAPWRLRRRLESRWPVREEVVDLTLSAVYPDLALPNDRHRIIVRKGDFPLSH